MTEQPNHWLSVALLPNGACPAKAAATLFDKGIEVRRSWKPMHLQPVFASNETIGGSVAEAFYNRGLCLPSAQSLHPYEVDRVIDAVSLAVVEGADQLVR